MAPAVERLAALRRAVTVHDPRTRLLSNARRHRRPRRPRGRCDRIVTQVSNPVRWDLCMQTMGELGVTGVIEVPPAGTLTGLIKRALPGVETVALKTPDDLDAARDLVERHGSAARSTISPTWRLLVSPLAGHVPASATCAVGTMPRARHRGRHAGRPPRRAAGRRPARRHGRRVARRGRRPGRPPASRSSGCTPKAVPA